MDLEELRSFLTVVEKGSFLSAADSLGMSRSTLRRRVGALEARAGVSLLESTQQGVVLTSAGEVLAKRGRLMVQEASALLASIREVGHEPEGTLKAVIPVGLPPHMLTAVFAALRSAYPKLKVHCRFSNDPLAELLVDVDMVIHFSDRPPDGPWQSYEILKIREWLVASPAYLARKGEPKTIEELLTHELFSWQAPGFDARVWRTLAGTSFEVGPALIATDIHWIRQCCLAGLGIGLVPDALLLVPDVPSDALVPVLPDIVGAYHRLRLTVPEALSEIPKIRMVVSRIRGFVNQL